MARYDKSELAALIERELDRAIGGDDSEYVVERVRNLQFYRSRAEGELAAPDTPDRSSIVATDVADTVEWMLPALVRVFSQSPESMECRPKSARFVPQARLASEYLRRIFWRENQGLMVIYEWFKAALVQRLGWVKVYYDDDQTDSEEVYTGLLTSQVAELLEQPGVTAIAQETRIEAIKPPPMPDPQTGQMIEPEAVEVEVIDLTLSRKSSRGRTVVEGVPPEEMRVHKRARYGREPLFIAQVRRETRQALEADGYDLEGVASDDALSEQEFERVGGQTVYATSDDEGEMQTYRVTEAYIRLDQDKDGVAEWRRVLMIGSTVFEDEKADGHPFVPFCPNPDPYVMVGQCPADFAIEPQRLNTSLLRALMDNVYLTVNQRTVVLDGQVNLDDLTQSRPGGVVRVRQMDSLMPLVQPQLDSGAWQMVEWGEQWRERRTGFTRYSQGMSPDALNPTATGVNIITEKADQRVELIARVAAVAMQEVFSKILRCVTRYQKAAEIIEIAGEWVELNPREWSDGYEIEINVALGTGSKDRKAMALQQVFGMQQPLLAAGQLPPQAAVATGRAFADAAGLGEPESFFPDPPPPQQPPPPPQVMVEQMKLQADAQRFQAQAQMDAARLQMEAQLQQQAKSAELEVQRQNDERDAQREQLRLQLEAEARAREAQAQQALEAQRLELDRYKADLEAQVRLTIAQMGKAGSAPGEGGGEGQGGQAGAVQQTLADLTRALQALSAPRELITDPATGRKRVVPVLDPQ